MLIYIEFISRRAGVSLEAFHQVAGRGQTGWADENAEDQLLLALGRTWRVGPEPEYLGVWFSPDGDLGRLDEWERIFRSGAADHVEQPFRLAARIDQAGCYEPLLPPIAGGDRERFYAEYFEIAAAAKREQVVESYRRRAVDHPELTLHLLVDSIGLLAPPPRALAVWSGETWAGLEALARSAPTGDGAINVAEVALYSSFGRETL